jgi:O-antigen/teichoic acid export membrane protein
MITPKTATNRRTFSRWFSDETLTKKAYLNAATAILDYGGRIAIAFVLNPILVSGLGDYFFGVWQIIMRLAGYLSIAGGRPTQALKWTVAHQQASTDYDRKRRDVGSAIAVWLLFLPILGALGAGLVWYSPQLLRAAPEFAWIVRIAVAVLVIDLLVTDLADVPQSVVRGENLGYKRFGLSTILLFVGGALTAAAVYSGTGLIGVASVQLVMTLLTGAFFLYVARQYVPWFAVAKPSRQDVRTFFGFSWWFLVWRLVQQAMMASDIVLLGLLSAVEMVTVYSLTKWVPEALTSLTVTAVAGIAPGLGGIIGAGNMPKAARVRSMIMALTWLVITGVGVTTLVWSESFIRLWVGPKYYAGPTSTLLIILMVAQLTLIRNDANIINLTLDLPKKVLIGMLSVALALSLAGVLIYFFHLGITGLCIGFIVGRSILSIAYPWSLSRFFGLSFYSQLQAALRPAIVTGLLFGLALGMRDQVSVNGWLSLIFAAGITLVTVSIVAFYAGLSSEQRSYIWTRLQVAVA